MVIHVGRSPPDHGHLVGIHAAFVHIAAPDLFIQGTHLIGPALDHSNRGVVAAAEAGGTSRQIGHGDAVLPEEVLGHQPTGGGAFGTEGQTAALQLHQLIGTGDGPESAGSVGDEHTGELGIDVSLGQHHGPWGLQTGLHTGESTKPDQIKTAAAEGADGGRVVADGYVPHRHIEGITQFVREGAVETVQLLGVLIRDGTDPENLICGGWCTAAATHGGREGNTGDETGDLHGRLFSSWHQVKRRIGTAQVSPSSCVSRDRPSLIVSRDTAQDRRMQRSFPKARPGTTARPACSRARRQKSIEPPADSGNCGKA